MPSRAGRSPARRGRPTASVTADVGFRLRVEVTAKNANGSGSALSNPSSIAVPSVPVTNARPTVKLISVRFLGARVYARFRICDDSPRNLTILATDSRPGKVSQTRRFTTRIAPDPCGVYTRSWVPAASASAARASTRSRSPCATHRAARARPSASCSSCSRGASPRRRRPSLQPGSRQRRSTETVE